jgi:arylsulfatase A-like enzyme
VPAIFWWPGRIPAGLEVTSPAIITDTIPTFAQLAGLPPLKSAVDAVSIAPLLHGQRPEAPRTLLFGSGDARAARRGKWKYLLTGEPSWKQDFRPEPMLFNLEDDPAESTNVADRFPEVARELREAIERFQVEASSPE